ncbi:MAG: hypothetical protein JSW52_06680 [Candidatus Coatesbacteria bacterium]|nr:MAG: hypothetical protein JSW52_06680 [Candidatus Coatesbacteria bacterium]
MRTKRKAYFISVLLCSVTFIAYYGCGGGKQPNPETLAEPERQERIIFAEDGVLYYNGPEVVFAESPTGKITVVEHGIERVIYEPSVGEKVFPLAANPDYVYFAVESGGRIEVKRVTTFNLGAAPEDYGEFDKELMKPYFVNADGGLVFSYVYYGENQVRLMAYGLPDAEPVAMSPPLPGYNVSLFPAPEQDSAYAVVDTGKYESDIYYFSEEGNETLSVINGVRFDEYYIENDRAFAIIGEKTSDEIRFTEADGEEIETPVDAVSPEPLFNTRILDLKARGSVPVYSVAEPEPADGGPSAGDNAPGNVMDGDLGTAWIVETDGSLIDRTVKIDFARPRPVRGLKIYSDPATGRGGRVNHGRPAVVTAELSDGTAVELAFDGTSPVAVGERRSIEPVEWIVLTVGPAPDDAGVYCVINEVQVY